jgi:predicted transposase YbfD/YdcC
MAKLEVECPECGGWMEIDSNTGKVLRHSKEKPRKQSLEEFMAGQKNRRQELEDKFREGVEKEKGKKERMDAKFKEAMEKARRGDEMPEPPSVQWD